MKTQLAFGCLLTGLSLPIFGDITTSGSAPATDLLVSNPSGGINTSLFDEDANNNHARGQLFSLGDDSGSAFEITAITVRKDINQTYGDSTITLRIFEGTQAEWVSGTGHSTAADGNDYLVDTSVDLLYTEAFDLDSTYNDSDYVTFTLATPLTVNENSDFGFFFVYEQGTGDPVNFQHLEGSAGGRISIDTGNHAVSSRNVVHFVQGNPVNAALAQVTTSSSAPTTDIIASSPTGTTDTALFDEDADANHGRGQLFSLPNGTGSNYEISALTLRKSTNQTFANDEVTLYFFEGTESQWNSGTGHTTATNGSDYYAGTTVTPLYNQTFQVDGTVVNNDFVTFELSSPLTVDENSDFGFFLIYNQSPTSTEDRFRHREDTTGGGRLSITNTSHSSSPDRKVHYYLQGMPVGTSSASLTLGSPFQNRMILQRDKPVKVWGTSDPSSAISVVIDGNTVNTTTDANGNWELELPTFAAGGPYSLTATTTSIEGTASETVNDILFGDVWFCFGQSNMRWRFSNLPGTVTWDDSYRTDLAANDNIRYLRTNENGTLTEQETAGMTWLANSSVSTWSAVASVFAHQLNAATNVPVGIIDSSWGSSSIEGWLPLSMADELPHFDEMLDHYQSISEYRAGDLVSARVEDGRVPGNTNEEAISLLSGTSYGDSSNANIFLRTRPNIIYNERVHPLRKYGISGFVWYQGEANSSILDSAQYQFSLPLMVEEYRERFGQGDLPFLGIQLPSYSTASWPWFREAQDSLLTVPNAYVAVTVDTGSSSTIHPSDKEEIGVRLSLLAREHALGESIESDSPRYLSHTINGNQITLTFENATGLSAPRVGAGGFEIAGADQVFHDVTTTSVSGNTITVSSTSESNPVAVRYAWTAVTHTIVNTVNGADLPLAPFRTDDWPIPGLAAQDPFGIDDSYSVLRDQTLTIPADGVLSNDFDLNLDLLEPTLGATTANGTLTLLADGSFTYVPEEGFAGQDSFTYQATEAGGGASSTTATVTITIEGTPSAYYTWRSGISWNSGDDETTQGDPDGDGVPNLMEFALNMNPLEQDLCDLPTLTPTATGADFGFNNAQAGVTYEVLLSTDLQTWSDPAFATLDSTGTTPVAIPDSEAVDGKLFVRLRVSEAASN